MKRYKAAQERESRLSSRAGQDAKARPRQSEPVDHDKGRHPLTSPVNHT